MIVSGRPTPCHILNTDNGQWELLADMHQENCIHFGGDAQLPAEEVAPSVELHQTPEEIAAETEITVPVEPPVTVEEMGEVKTYTEVPAQPEEEQSTIDTLPGWEDLLINILPENIDPELQTRIQNFIGGLLIRQQEELIQRIFQNMFK